MLASRHLDARAFIPSPAHLHPSPANAGPALPDCTSGVPARAPSASHAHARGQQLQDVTTALPAFKKVGEGEGEGAADAQPALGEGVDTEAKVRHQKSEDRDATPDLLLKHQDPTLATYV